MDTSYENEMYQQIENSLSDNDKLFVPIEILDENTQVDVVNDYKESEQILSRAEYIRVAREACLRQMDESYSTSRFNDVYDGGDYLTESKGERKKRDKSKNLFYDGREDEVMPGEVASYRSLIIRTICAVVIFLFVFIIDKLKVDFGSFSYEDIRQYVTGSDKLKALEEILVSWIK